MTLIAPKRPTTRVPALVAAVVLAVAAAAAGCGGGVESGVGDEPPGSSASPPPTPPAVVDGPAGSGGGSEPLAVRAGLLKIVRREVGADDVTVSVGGHCVGRFVADGGDPAVTRLVEVPGECATHGDYAYEADDDPCYDEAVGELCADAINTGQPAAPERFQVGVTLLDGSAAQLRVTDVWRLAKAQERDRVAGEMLGLLRLERTARVPTAPQTRPWARAAVRAAHDVAGPGGLRAPASVLVKRRGDGLVEVSWKATTPPPAAYVVYAILRDPAKADVATPLAFVSGHSVQVGAARMGELSNIITTDAGDYQIYVATMTPPYGFSPHSTRVNL